MVKAGVIEEKDTPAFSVCGKASSPVIVKRFGITHNKKMEGLDNK